MADKDWWKDETDDIELDNPFLSDERRKELERFELEKKLENNPFKSRYE